MNDRVEPLRVADTGTHWVDSGSGPGYVVDTGGQDGRPEFSPVVLVVAVLRTLLDRGVQVEPEPGMMHTAAIAAADLLRALGVKPVNAPRTTAGLTNDQQWRQSGE